MSENDSKDSTAANTAAAVALREVLGGCGTVFLIATKVWAIASWVFGQSWAIPFGPPEYLALVAAASFGIVMLNHEFLTRQSWWRPRDKLFALLEYLVEAQHWFRSTNPNKDLLPGNQALDIRSDLKRELGRLRIGSPSLSAPDDIWAEYMTEIILAAEKRNLRGARALKYSGVAPGPLMETGARERRGASGPETRARAPVRRPCRGAAEHTALGGSACHGRAGIRVAGPSPELAAYPDSGRSRLRQVLEPRTAPCRGVGARRTQARIPASRRRSLSAHGRTTINAALTAHHALPGRCLGSLLRPGDSSLPSSEGGRPQLSDGVLHRSRHTTALCDRDVPPARAGRDSRILQESEA